MLGSCTGEGGDGMERLCLEFPEIVRFIIGAIAAVDLLSRSRKKEHYEVRL
jgi:hypothetical protein